MLEILMDWELKHVLLIDEEEKQTNCFVAKQSKKSNSNKQTKMKAKQHTINIIYVEMWTI